MALKGIRVIELEGLAPAPLCGMLLNDFGATVIVVSKFQNSPFAVLDKGKIRMALNLNLPKAQEILRKLCSRADVVIDPYRPGVMEKLNLGPDQLLGDNPKLIYARLTGFGQTGPFAHKAGHDINYIALSGVLSMFGERNRRPQPPINFAADFAGGGLLCAFGILIAICERFSSGCGQIVDCSMTEGAAYVASWLFQSRPNLPIWTNADRGESTLDGGAFYYNVYETKDGEFMSVGALEAKFFQRFIRTIGLPSLQQIGGDNECSYELVRQRFMEKTQQEWIEIFDKVDACVFPVLRWQNACNHLHNKYRNAFVVGDCDLQSDRVVPAPAPILSRTPAISGTVKESASIDLDAHKYLHEIGLTNENIEQLQQNGVLEVSIRSKM